MPEPVWVRVKDDRSGHEYSICRDPFEGETVIEKDAADALNNPLPAKPNVNADRRKSIEPPATDDGAPPADDAPPATPPAESTEPTAPTLTTSTGKPSAGKTTTKEK